MITENTAEYKPKHLNQKEEPKLSQTEMLARHLNDNGSITSLEAIELYGCTRLSARVWELRHKYGIEVTSTTEVGKNRYGRMVNYTRYSLGGTE